MNTDQRPSEIETNGDFPQPPRLEPTPPQITEEPPLKIGATGIIARKRGDTIIVLARDGSDLFSFNARVCPYEANAIGFLVEIYSIGYGKGRAIGREVCKAQMREILGPEL